MAGYACGTLHRAGFPAEILDARELSFAESEEWILDAAPDILAVHAVYFWEGTGELFASLQRLKDSGFVASICLFGFFPSLCWADILAAYPQVDYIAAGEPEQTLVDLARALDRGSQIDIPGLAQVKAGKPTLTTSRSPHRDLDALPFPARPFLRREKTVSVLASRGCYNRCHFCLVPAFGGGKSPWRGRSVQSVAEEIAQLKEAGKTDFYFVDPNFIGPGNRGVERTLAMAAALSELEITFGMECRASDVRPDLMKALARAGLTSLLMGLESGTQNSLDRMGKNITPQQNLEAVQMVRHAGLEPEVGFIMFEPWASLSDVANNLAFLREAQLLDRLGRTANLLYHNQIALKGTQLYGHALVAGLLRPEGIVGFEGRLVYRDPMVAWLAQVMRRLCLVVLRAMGDLRSGIHWSREAQREPYTSVNQVLVEQFQRLLSLVRSRARKPDSLVKRIAVESSFGEVTQALTQARQQAQQDVI